MQYQASGPIRIGSGKQHAHVATLGGAKQHGALRAHRIHHRVHVFHTLLQRWISNFAVGESGPALVEADEARKPAEAFNQSRLGRILPVVVDVADPPRHPNKIDWAIASHLISDADVARLGVVGLGTHESELIPSLTISNESMLRQGVSTRLGKYPLRNAT